LIKLLLEAGEALARLSPMGASLSAVVDGLGSPSYIEPKLRITRIGAHGLPGRIKTLLAAQAAGRAQPFRLARAA